MDSLAQAITPLTLAAIGVPVVLAAVGGLVWLMVRSECRAGALALAARREAREQANARARLRGLLIVRQHEGRWRAALRLRRSQEVKALTAR